MLKKITIVLTGKYKEKIEKSHVYENLQGIVKRNQAQFQLYETEVFGEKYKNTEMTAGKSRDEFEGLWLCDDAKVLETLQNAGAFTVAVYHEDVKGLLSGTQYAVEGLSDIDWEYLNKIYQRYCKVPWEITETKRCKIREMGIEDTDALYELYADEQVTRYTEDLFKDKEQEKRYIEEYVENIYKYYGFGTWLTHRKEDGVLIGRAGFNYRPGYEEAELGFIIGYPYWRQGYAYEVCTHLLQLGKEVFEFERVQAFVDKENKASIELLKKLGFSYKEETVLDDKKYLRYLYC